MPRCKISSVHTPEVVQHAFEQLDAQVVGPALKRVGHGSNGFYLGRIPGTLIEDLFEATNIDLEQSEIDWLHGRPRLLSAGGRRQLMVVGRSRAKGRSHRDYNLASDLLRGLADSRIASYIADADSRNAMCRDFADGWLFGHPLRFGELMGKFGSINNVHDDHLIPTSALASYAAKVRLSQSSVSTLFVVQDEDRAREFIVRHRIGVARDVDFLSLEHSRLGERFTLEGVRDYGRTWHTVICTHTSMDIFVSASAGKVLTTSIGADHCADIDLLKVMFAILPQGNLWVPPWHSSIIH